MSETTEKLVGIKQVLLPEFKAAEEAGTTKGYMWFVRDNNITLHNYIYLGSRLYGEAEIEVPFDSVITNILSDNSIVVTKTSSEEGTTVELKINLDPNGGLTLTENGLQVDMSKFISQSELDKVKDDIKTVNDNLVTSINTINQNVADGFNTINGGIENEIKPAIAEAKKLAVDETERALVAETNLQTNINVETTERKIDVANLQGNINIETERALAAEAALAEKVKEVDVDEIKADIKTVNDNLVTSINTINQNVADGFNTINGGIENEIKPAIAEAKKLAVDETERALVAETNLQTNINVETTERKIDVANLQGNINIETERALAAEAALAEKVKEVDVDEIKADIKTVNDNLVTAVNTINQNMADGFNTINGGIDNEIRPELAKAVKYQEFDTNRKTIQLANFDTLSGIMTDGEGVNLAMVSKWDKADFGSTKLPFNMNGSEERPTYNDTKEVALMDDINSEITNESDRVNAMIDVINESIKTVNNNLVDAVNTINGGIDNEIRPAIEDLKENKVSYVETEKEGKKYKVIQLDNYANLVGEGADELSGQTFNIGMVSKWNKVDLGSASLEINLNGKANRPTYNDTKEIALIEDVNGKVSSVELVQDVDNQLHYELMVDGVVKGDINIPKDQFLKNVEYDDTTKELVFTFDTTDGEKVTKVNIGELVDTYEAGNGLELTGNVFSIKLDPSSQSYIQVTSDGIKIIAIDEAISEINGKITAEETRASGVEAKLRTDVDYEHERALEAEANINNALETKVTWDESKSKIVLPSGGQIVGTKYGTDGSNPADGATIAQLSQYDIMDFGSSKYPLNLNVPAGVRVTVQEQGQSGKNANKIAYLSDVEVKVDKVDGKGLSEEDFTTALKTKLEGLSNYDDTDIKNDIASLDTAYKTADTALEEKITANEQAIATKVDKVDGMGLSQENFTTVEKTKLTGLSNYDDTAIKASIEENKTNIASVRSDLTAESTLQATNYNDLNTRLNSEVTRATDREDEIEANLNKIVNNGLILQQGKSISAYPYPNPDITDPSSPVDILTLKSGNTLEIGSNINSLILIGKGSITAKLDGVAKEIALKEQIDALQTTINSLIKRIEALEAKNP